MIYDLIYTTLLTLASYAGAFWYLFLHLIRKNKINFWLFGLFLCLGLGLHGLILFHSMITPLGVNYDVFNVISFTSALMLLLSISFSLYRPILPLNLIGIPIAICGVILGSSFRLSYQLIAQSSLGLNLHIILSLSAYALLFMATIHAILIWMQNRELKKKQKRLWVNLLPSVQTMESLLFDFILTGFITLTIALVIGLFTIDDFFSQHLVHKTFFAVLSWLIYSTLLIGHYFLGWRGQKAIRFSLIAFLLLALGFIGGKFILEMLL